MKKISIDISLSVKCFNNFHYQTAEPFLDNAIMNQLKSFDDEISKQTFFTLKKVEKTSWIL